MSARILLCLFLLPVMFGILLIPGRGDAAEPKVPSIESINFTGNETIEAGELRGVMRLRQPVWWNPFRKTPYLGVDYLTADLYRILDLCRDEGFPLAMIKDASVQTVEGEDKVRLLIDIHEGPRCAVRDINLSGVQESMRKKAWKEIGLKPGDFLRSSKLTSSRHDLEAFLVEGGYLGALVNVDVALSGSDATVDVRATEGSRYTMRGVVIDTTAGPLERTKPLVIRREVDLKPGDAFRTSKVLKTQERLFETGIFRTVRVLPLPDSLGEPVADLRVVVHERNSGWYGFGAGYSSDDRMRFVAEWGNRNISGKARRLVVDGDLSFALDKPFGDQGFPVRTALARVRFTNPWTFNTRTRSQTSLYHTYEVVTPADDNTEIYNRDITALEEALSRSIGRHSTIGIGISNKWVRTGDPNPKEYQTRNVSAVLEEDRRDDFLDPSRGTYVRLLGEYAGGLLGGRNEFSRWTVNTSWYVPFLGKLVFATRVRAGLIVPVGKGVGIDDDSLLVARIPGEERFRLGGGTTVRGYRDNSLGRIGPEPDRRVVGGTALLLGNAELRFPIVWRFKGAIFLDAGNVWADPKEIKLQRFRDGFDRDSASWLNVAYSVGGGLRFMTPVGPFRFDYGYRIGGGQIPGDRRGGYHLSLGQAF